MVLPLTVMAADPAEGHEAEIPAWVNAGAERFEGTDAMKPYLSRERKPDVHSGELAQAASAIIDDLGGKVAGDTRELVHKTHEKVSFLTENAKFDWFAYSSMHMYLASLISPKETDIGIFVDRLKDFSTAWKNLVSEDKASLDLYDEYMNRAIGYNAAEYGLTPKVLSSLVLLPMYASSQEEGNLGVKPLLENTLKGYIPFILTPPGEASVHGGIVQSPLEMVAHDFAHALIIQSYLANGLYGPELQPTGFSFSKLLGRLSGADQIGPQALRALHELNLTTLEGQRSLMKLFVIFHEFSTNDAFKTVGSYTEKNRFSRPSSLDDFIQKNLTQMGQIYDSDDAKLEEAMMRDLVDKVKKELPKEWSKADFPKEYLKSRVAHIYVDGKEIKRESRQPHPDDEYKDLYKRIEFDQFWHVEGHIIAEGLMDKKDIPLVLFSQYKQSDSLKSLDFRAINKNNDNFMMSDFIFTRNYVLRNFSDYGEILKMVGLVEEERDFQENPLAKDELIAGLQDLMRH
ncbi:MAG: hypothetical protein C0582_04745 [Alphaproteobacteria bacterium]|nr:MAG: hypothetical protein C0582_04745 [Alphaproteobacteria bacterium]